MNILKTLILCLLLITTQANLAQAKQYQHGIGPGEAASLVQHKLGGRILAVETLHRNGKTFYRIKILTRKGVVRVVRVNAANGRFR
ncbi:MAG: hypothetical protein GXP16_11020 [Gammaproteobacteria bacterium]|nr:hypothetical protein [Gammaproteobacteria bacterium]